MFTKKKISKKKDSILLIGGAGYIGSILSEYLIKKNYHVNCLDLCIYNNNHSIQNFKKNKNFFFFKDDFRNKKILEKALKNVKDVIILASIVGDPISKIYPKETKKINFYGTKELFINLNKKNLNKVIFISTCSNYGMQNSNKFADENSKLKPLSLYAKSKVYAEKELMKLKNKTDYVGVILRFATAFGISPRMRFDLTLNEFVRDIFFNKKLIIYDENTWRPYCHVQDFCRIIFKVLKASKKKVYFEIFNAGSSKNNYRKKDLVNLIRKFVNFDFKIEKYSGSTDKRNYKVDFSKLKKQLSITTKFSVLDGIKEIINNFRKGHYVDSQLKKNFYGNFKIKKKL